MSNLVQTTGVNTICVQCMLIVGWFAMHSNPPAIDFDVADPLGSELPADVDSMFEYEQDFGAADSDNALDDFGADGYAEQQSNSHNRDMHSQNGNIDDSNYLGHLYALSTLILQHSLANSERSDVQFTSDKESAFLSLNTFLTELLKGCDKLIVFTNSGNCLRCHDKGQYGLGYSLNEVGCFCPTCSKMDCIKSLTFNDSGLQEPCFRCGNLCTSQELAFSALNVKTMEHNHCCTDCFVKDTDTEGRIRILSDQDSLSNFIGAKAESFLSSALSGIVSPFVKVRDFVKQNNSSVYGQSEAEKNLAKLGVTTFVTIMLLIRSIREYYDIKDDDYAEVKRKYVRSNILTFSGIIFLMSYTPHDMVLLVTGNKDSIKSCPNKERFHPKGFERHTHEAMINGPELVYQYKGVNSVENTRKFRVNAEDVILYKHITRRMPDVNGSLASDDKFEGRVLANDCQFPVDVKISDLASVNVTNEELEFFSSLIGETYSARHNRVSSRVVTAWFITKHCGVRLAEWDGSIPDTGFPKAEVEGFVVESLDKVVKMFTSLGECFTDKDYGKVLHKFASVLRDIKSIKDDKAFFSLVTTMANWVCSEVFGMSPYFVDKVGDLTKDLQTFVLRSNPFMGVDDSTILAKKENLDTLAELCVFANNIDEMLVVNRQVHFDTSVYTKASTRVRSLYSFASKFFKESFIRQSPVVVMFCGAPGTGKSVTMSKMTNDIYKYHNEMGTKGWDVPCEKIQFSWPTGKFWDGYNGQKIINMSEAFQDESPERRAEEMTLFIKVADNVEVLATMANLEQKNAITICPEYMFMSSNVVGKIDGKIADPYAVMRRIDFEVETVRNPRYTVGGNEEFSLYNVYRWVPNADIRDINKWVRKPVNKDLTGTDAPISYENLISLVVDRYDEKSKLVNLYKGDGSIGSKIAKMKKVQLDNKVSVISKIKHRDDAAMNNYGLLKAVEIDIKNFIKMREESDNGNDSMLKMERAVMAIKDKVHILNSIVANVRADSEDRERANSLAKLLVNVPTDVGKCGCSTTESVCRCRFLERQMDFNSHIDKLKNMFIAKAEMLISEITTGEVNTSSVSSFVYYGMLTLFTLMVSYCSWYYVKPFVDFFGAFAKFVSSGSAQKVVDLAELANSDEVNEVAREAILMMNHNNFDQLKKGLTTVQRCLSYFGFYLDSANMAYNKTVDSARSIWSKPGFKKLVLFSSVLLTTGYVAKAIWNAYYVAVAESEPAKDKKQDYKQGKYGLSDEEHEKYREHLDRIKHEHDEHVRGSLRRLYKDDDAIKRRLDEVDAELRDEYQSNSMYSFGRIQQLNDERETLLNLYHGGEAENEAFEMSMMDLQHFKTSLYSVAISIKGLDGDVKQFRLQGIPLDKTHLIVNAHLFDGLNVNGQKDVENVRTPLSGKWMQIYRLDKNGLKTTTINMPLDKIKIYRDTGLGDDLAIIEVHGWAPFPTLSPLIDESQIPNIPTRGYMLKIDPLSNSLFSIRQLVDLSLGGRIEFYNGGIKHFINHTLRYNVLGGKTSAGDCGSLIVAKIQNQYRIIGFHAYGQNYTDAKGAFSGGCFVTRGLRDDLIRRSGGSVPLAQMEEYISGLEEIDGPCYRNFRVPLSDRVFTPMKTSIVHSPLYDVITESGYDVNQPAMQGDCSAKLQKVINEKMSLLTSDYIEPDDVKFGVEATLHYLPPSNFTVDGVGVGDILTVEQALNSMPFLSSIDKTTSAGKEVHDLGLGNGKLPYLVLSEENTIVGLHDSVQRMVDEIHNDVLSGKLRPTINHMYLKDETLPKEKDKVRLIQVLNLAYVTLFRQVFGLFLNRFNELQPVSFSAVGIDPHSEEWDIMAKNLVQYCMDIVAGDVKAYDYTEPYPVEEGCYELINTYCNFGKFDASRFEYTCSFLRMPKDSDPQLVKEKLSQYRIRLMDCVILGYKQIFDKLFWTGGQVPTGWPLTAQFNSMGIAIKIFAVLGRCCNMTPYEVSKSFAVKVFGDDHLIGFKNETAKVLTLPMFIKKFDELFHMEITASDKGDVVYDKRPLVSEVFLGRGFLLRGGRYYAPRKMEEMYDSLRWMKKGNDKEYSSTLISFLQDLKEFGELTYRKHHSQLQDMLDSVGYVPVDPVTGQPVVLPGYDFIVQNSHDLDKVRLPTFAVAEMETINVDAVDTENGVKNVVSLPGTSIEHGVQLSVYNDLEADGNDGDIPHLKRRVLALQSTVTTTTGRATVATIDMFATILSDNYLKNLIAGHRYANITFVARVSISGDRYCGGYMSLTYSPGDYYDTTTQNLPPECNTGWVNTVLDYSKDTEIEIEIPYFGPLPAIDIIQYQSGQMANLVIDNLGFYSINGATTASISYNVYVSIKNIHLYGKCADPLPTYTSGVRGPRAEMESVLKSAKGVVVGVANDATHWFGNTVTRAVSTLTNDDIGRKTGNLAESLVKFGRKKLFGFDKPLDVSSNVKCYTPTILPGSSNGDGLDFSTNLATHVLQQDGHNAGLVDRGMRDDMDLTELSKIPSLLNSYQWSTADVPGTVIGRIYVNPKWIPSVAPTTSGVSFKPTVLATVATPFSNWKGDLNYKLKIGATGFHSGRLRLVYSPMSTVIGESCNKAFYDVRGSMDIDYSLPFPHNKPWANESVGCISIVVENQLVCSSGSTTSSIPLLLYVNGTNMRYARMSGKYFVPDEMVMSAPSAEGMREEFDKPFEPMVDQMKSVCVDGFALEEITHLGDVLKRGQAEINGYNVLNPLTPTGSTYIFSGPIRTGKVYYAGPGGVNASLVFPTLGTTPLTPVRPTNMSHYATMFSYYRGALSYKLLLNNNLGITNPNLSAVDRNQINATLVPGYIRSLTNSLFASNGYMLNTDQYPTLISTKYEGNILVTVPSNSNSLLIPTGRPVVDPDMWPYGLCISSGVGNSTIIERALISAADDFRFYYPRSSGVVRAVFANDSPGATDLYYFYDPSVSTIVFG